MRKYLAALAALAAAIALSACNPIPANEVSANTLRNLKITSVEVRDANIIQSWPAEEQAARELNLITEEEASRLATTSAENFPKIHPHFQNKLQAHFKAGFDEHLGSLMTGSQPVKAVVTLKRFDIPSVGWRLLVGGNSAMRAEIDLVDAKTGRVVVHYPGEFRQTLQVGGVLAVASAVAAAAAGSEDTAIRMTRNYAEAYKNWLFP